MESEKPLTTGMLSRKASWRKVLSIVPRAVTDVTLVFGYEVGGEENE